jgi:hypothetical protein
MSKFIEELTEFSAAVAKLPPAEKAKMHAAMRASIGPVKATRKFNGKAVELRDVDWSVITESAPPDLRQDARQLQRSFNDEVKKRGQPWGDEAGHLIVTNRLLPQPTAGEQLVAATPGLVDAIISRLPMSAPQEPAVTDQLVDAILAKIRERTKNPDQPQG